MPTPHGRFVWYELLTSDPDAAQRFYGSVAGWGTQQWNDGPVPYTMWINDGAPLGGLMAMPENIRAMGVPPNWLPYVGVRDVDAAARDVTRLGGTVLHEPEDLPGLGRFAVIRDPQGAELALYASSSAASDTGEAPRRGQFSWHELMTTDYRAAFDFYSKLFDWATISDYDMGAMGIYRLYGQHGQQYGGMFNTPPAMAAPPNWLCYIRVDDVRRAADTVTRLGGKVLNGPMEVPGGDWIAQCMDPQGAAFAVHQKKA